MIHLIIRNTGSGKTTYLNELRKKANGIIFSIDKWKGRLQVLSINIKAQ